MIDNSLSPIIVGLLIFILAAALAYLIFHWIVPDDPMSSIFSYAGNWVAWALILTLPLGVSKVWFNGVIEGIAQTVVTAFAFAGLAFVLGILWALTYHHKHFKSNPIEDKLDQIDDLLERKVISQEEYERKRAKILNEQ